MTRSLYLIEEWPVPENLLNQWAQTEGAQIVSLNVQSTYGLSRSGIPFKRCDEFYRPEEYEVIGVNNFEKVKDFVQFIDRELLAVDEIRKAGLAIAEANYTPLKVLFDSISLAAFEIKRVIETTRPSHIYFYGWPIRDLNTEIQFTNEETLYGRIVQTLSLASGIPFDILNTHSQTQDHQISFRARFKGFLKRKIDRSLRARLLLIKHIIWPVFSSWILNSFKQAKHTKLIFLLNPARDVDYIAQEIIHRNIRPLYLIDTEKKQINLIFPFRFLSFCFPESLKTFPNRETKNTIQHIGEHLFLQRDFLKFFEFNGMNLWDVVQHKMRWLFKRIFSDNFEGYQIFKDYKSHIKSNHAQLLIYGTPLLMSNTGDSQMEMALHSAREEGIYVNKHQHGSDGFFYFPLLPRYSFTNADKFIVYGEGVEKDLQRQFKPQIELTPKGSATLDHLQSNPELEKNRRLLRKRGVDLNRSIVVYPLSVMAFNRMYISNHLYRDWEYYEIHRKIADVFRAYPDIQLVIKTHPSPRCPESPVVQYIQDQKISNCHVIRSGSFKDLLYQADLFIIDSPSTIVLEAMTTPKKILIYNGVLQFEPEARELITKRCLYHEKDLDVFLNDLRHLLERKAFENAPDNREFLRAYGTYLDDGHSAERVVLELLKPTTFRTNLMPQKGQVQHSSESDQQRIDLAAGRI